MNRSEILEYLGEDWTRVGAFMKDALHSDIILLNTTNNGLLANSGKLLRPIITLLMARACGESNQDSCRFAAAVEILHNATLLHDDVADESTERRGVPTVNALLGPQAAVLVGDFWLARAVELTLGSSIREEEFVRLYSKTLVDLAEGEMLQLEKASSADTEESDYYKIIYCKTASLFEAACLSAAMSVGASEEYLQAAGQYAEAAGIAFQIKDDILDYAGDAGLGKPVGIDLQEQKITLPLLGALKGSPREKEIREMVRDIRNHPEYCGLVRDFVLECGGVEYAAAQLDRYIDKAVHSLDILPDTPARRYLADIARYNAFRSV